MKAQDIFAMDDLMVAMELREKAEAAYNKAADDRTDEEKKLAKWWEYHLLSLMGVAFTI